MTLFARYLPPTGYSRTISKFYHFLSPYDLRTRNDPTPGLEVPVLLSLISMMQVQFTLARHLIFCLSVDFSLYFSRAHLPFSRERKQWKTYNALMSVLSKRSTLKKATCLQGSGYKLMTAAVLNLQTRSRRFDRPSDRNLFFHPWCFFVAALSNWPSPKKKLLRIAKPFK